MSSNNCLHRTAGTGEAGIYVSPVLWGIPPNHDCCGSVRREVQPLVEPLIVSWGYHATPKTTSGSRFIDYLQWTGTKDPAAALAVPAAIQFMRDHKWDEVRQECHALLRQAVERVCALTEMPPLYPLDSDFYSQMAIAPLPANADLVVLKSRLYDEYKVEVPLIQWRDRKFIRLSIQGYNTPSDVDALLEALGEILPSQPCDDNSGL